MTTCVAVKKDGFIVLATDTRITSGDLVCPPTKEMENTGKVVVYEGTYLALTGYAVSFNYLEEYLRLNKPALSSTHEVWTFWTAFHQFAGDRKSKNQLKYLELLVVNANGVFQCSTNRHVCEVSGLAAIGSGAYFALGAAAAFLQKGCSAAEVAAKAVEIACMFDSGSGLPVRTFVIGEN
jgi:ATP-dependent protease HslVU (ClpYQ) peptidase subunit